MFINFKEAIECLEDGMDIRVTVGGSTVTIGDMHNYVGAPEDEVGYISEYLGNVWFEDAEQVIQDTVTGMANGDNKLIESAKFWVD